MNLIKLKLKNFLSYKESTIDFNDNGIYMIYGVNKQTGSNNGVGKSAIKEAIQYVLFGKCRVNSADAMIRFEKDAMLVAIKFELDGKNIVIKRSRDRNKSTKLVLFIDKKDVSQTSIKLTDEYIQNMLGLDYEKFMHSFCFGQSEYDDLKQLTSAKLIEFLKSVLKLDRFDLYLDKVKGIKEKNNNKINKLLGMKDTYSKIVDVDINKKDIQKQLDKKIKQRIKVEDKIKVIKKEYNLIDIKLDGLKSNLREERSMRDKITNQLTHISTNTTCPTCKQKLQNQDLKKKLKKELKELDASIEISTLAYDKLDSESSELGVELDAVNDIYADYRNEVIELKTKLEISLQSNVDIKEIDKDYTKAIEVRSILVGLTDVFNSKGLPLFVLNSYIPKLEFLINDILGRVCDFKIHLRTTKELKSKEKRNTCEIKLTKGSREYPLENLSNAEEFIITLAFRIGTSKLLSSTNTKFETLILDECFGSLGDSNRRKVLALINSLEKDFKKIIIISHVSEIREWRKPYKIEIEKDKDISTIIQNNLGGYNG